MKEVLNQCETKEAVYGGILDKDILIHNLHQNCIPEGFENMDIENYQEFLLKRRKLMAQKIRKYYEKL